MSLHVSIVGQDSSESNIGSARNIIDDGDDELVKVDGKFLTKTICLLFKTA